MQSREESRGLPMDAGVRADQAGQAVEPRPRWRLSPGWSTEARSATTFQRLDGRSGRELGRQPSERARHGHSRRVDGAHPEVRGDFGQTPLRFEARQN